MTATQRFAEWATALELEDAPAEVVEAAKLHLLDTLGCGLAATALDVGREGVGTMAELGGDDEATVIGGPGLPAPNAAFANAMVCHGLDFDDTHSDSVAHVSVVTCPTALATAEATGASGRDALAAVLAGNEIVTRIGMAASGLFHKRGFHPTSICGVFGATAGAARLGGLDAERTASALGIAGSLASGLFAYLDDGTPTKPIHPGWAAHGAILAARLAGRGAEGPPGVLEGRFGLYHAFLGAEKGEIDIDGQLADLGERWETPRIAYKPYPACHFMHGSVGATAEASAHGLDPDEIKEIVVTVPAAGVDLVLEPEGSKFAPRTTYEAKFSLQYSAAAMIVHGRCGVTTYTPEAIREPRVLDLAKRVRYEVKDYPTYPGAFPGGVRITTHDGRTLESDLAHQREGPENPMSVDEVRVKFRENAGLALPEDEVSALENAVLALEEQDDLRRALAPLARASVTEGAPRLTPMAELTAETREIVATIREFVERDVVPVASDLEHADEYPTELVETMKELGLFGVTVPEEYGGLGLDLTTYALIQVELSRGWMSLSGVLNTHFISAWMIKTYGTDEQRSRYLPRMATGELHFAYSMTEPHAGSDVQAIRTRAVREGDEYIITGQKMWATNGLRSSGVMLLAKTDPDADPPHRGMTAFVLEKEPGVSEQPGLTIPKPLRKLGYKGVESTELVFDGFRTPASSVLGGPDEEGKGFRQFMGGIELGRVNIAARAVGIAQAAFEAAIRYAQEREAFGKPIAHHQAIQLKLAQMATKIEASRLLMLEAAQKKDAGERADLEAGMAKLFATETAEEVALEAMRIHGGYGYSQEYVVERIYRDAPVLILGEGSNEIQQLVIARRLLERHAV